LREAENILLMHSVSVIAIALKLFALPVRRKFMREFAQRLRRIPHCC